MQLKEAQQKQVNDLVEKLSFTDAKELLKKLALAQLSLVLDVAEKMLAEEDESDLETGSERPERYVSPLPGNRDSSSSKSLLYITFRHK